MEYRRIYQDIAERTGGDIYIGVVGPVRTGKSTFIRRFAEKMILPYMGQESGRRELIDELPQAAEGKTVMTCEPKFIPASAAKISLAENVEAGVRLIDCVGFPVEGAIPEEDGKPRMVSSPWSDAPLPFAEAARIGTEKVIREHSTAAVLVTTDGTPAGIAREAYIAAEERAARELSALGKPFVILVNSREAGSGGCAALAASLAEKYGAAAMPFDCENASAEEFAEVLEQLLFAFPVQCIDFDLPEWMRTLPEDDPIVAEALSRIREGAASVVHMRDLALLEQIFDGSEYFLPPSGSALHLGEGRAEYTVTAKEGVFYRALSEESGADLSGDVQLMAYVRALGRAKKFYEKFAAAVRTADETGYGIVMPKEEDLVLEAPELTRSERRSGILLRAGAVTYHVVRVDVKGETAPVLGDAARSEEIARSLAESYERDPEGLWNTELFGRTFKDMVREGLEARAGGMPAEVRKKIARTLGRIVNEGRGGVICILL